MMIIIIIIIIIIMIIMDILHQDTFKCNKSRRSLIVSLVDIWSLSLSNEHLYRTSLIWQKFYDIAASQIAESFLYNFGLDRF